MKVILFSAQAQCGKDTCADKLAELLNVGHSQTSNHGLDWWWRGSFAYNVKRIFKEAFGVTDEFIEEWKVKSECPENFLMPCRKALQFIGDGFRTILPTIWMDYAFRDKTQQVILSDGRYCNEWIRCKAEGGCNLLVGRPDRLNDDPNESESQIRPYLVWCYENLDKNVKLHDLRGFDYTGMNPPPNMEKFDFFIWNNSTKEELYEVIENELTPLIKAFEFD